MSRRRLDSPFPKEDAPNYDPDNPYADRVALSDHRRYLVGRYFIAEAKARILREKLKVCYATHGVNHLDKCKKYRTLFWEAAQAVKIGWIDAPAWKPVEQ